VLSEVAAAMLLGGTIGYERERPTSLQDFGRICCSPAHARIVLRGLQALDARIEVKPKGKPRQGFIPAYSLHFATAFSVGAN
jgi:hypothetical protein